ncbi:DUF3992 domain-containing protein [Bacillus thuringiensis]|uniref:DUF3992 domain-containing protein n=1 Tax=Bacillus thuringiensis TaxID=1428 RepID=UPI000B6985E1|nr:S-Ena type endospore appendage [Bacillus thuringiensis]OUA88796.1 hypothetical protein BK706_17075 [Bacillus thuringiensis serovar leesis]
MCQQERFINCCKSKQFVQDKICNHFTATGADEVGSTVVYASSTNQVIYASGWFKNEGRFPLTVQFVRGADPITGSGGVIARQAIVPIEGSSLFTVSKFDTIRVFAVGATSEFTGSGEFCITPRYAIR